LTNAAPVLILSIHVWVLNDFRAVCKGKLTMHIGIVTLGCDKNTVDTEYIAGLLASQGHEVFTPGMEDELDALAVNTCGFIESAKQESIDAILLWVEEKKRRQEETGTSFYLYVIGCLVERYASELLEAIPEIDGLAGVGEWKRTARMILSSPDRKSVPVAVSPPGRLPDMKITRCMPRKKLDPEVYAFLKIADGCSHSCRFCAIPFIKGKRRSVPRKILLREAADLIRRGAREINLVAQDSSLYGTDLYQKYRLTQLVRDIARLPGKFWIRVLYTYPATLSDDFIRLMREEENLCPYLDVPLQHLSPEVLRRMGRPPDPTRILNRLNRWRKEIPELTIRTTFIVGFPGETRRDFEILLEGVRDFGFDRIGAFLYSPEEGTAAFDMDRVVSKRTARRRLDRLMRVQAGISLEKNRRLIGKVTSVLIEEEIPGEKIYLARSMADAPEVDGLVIVRSDRKLPPGTFARCRIKDAGEYDLLGELEG